MSFTTASGPQVVSANSFKKSFKKSFKAGPSLKPRASSKKLESGKVFRPGKAKAEAECQPSLSNSRSFRVSPSLRKIAAEAVAAQDSHNSPAALVGACATDGEEDVCWICLGEAEEGDQLRRPCNCPRLVHARCMARWQMQCSGKSEEVSCKFCNTELPNWRHTLFQEIELSSTNVEVAAASGSSSPSGSERSSENSNSSSTNAANTSANTPLVKGDVIVQFNNMSFRCQVRTGPDGLADFMDQIRQRCAIPEEKMSSLELTYRCKDPRSGTPMTLEGVNESAFDAAVLCSASAMQDKIKHGDAASQATTQQQQQAQQQTAAGKPCVTTAGAGRRRSNVFMSALRYLTHTR